MHKPRLLAIQCGAIIITAISLFSLSRTFLVTGNAWLNTNEPDAISRFEKRFDAVHGSLPAGGVIGYMTEVSPQQVMADGNATAEYYLTQYALAPLIVDNSPRHAFVVANLHSSALPDWSASGKFIMVKDTGTGIILYRNEDVQP